MSTQLPGLFIMESEGKGRGVFTSGPISKGDFIESAPVIILKAEDREIIHNTKLHDYYFLWDNEPLIITDDPEKKKNYSCALALGYGSLYNHSKTPTASYTLVYNENCIEFIALRDIDPGEEITIDYNDEESEEFPLWFEADSEE